MKIVSNEFKHGVAARNVQPMSNLRRRNPAIKEIRSGASKQIIEPSYTVDGLGTMGDWWDDLVNAGEKLWDDLIDSGQKAATQYVQKELVKIIGADGKVKEVDKNSTEYKNYVAQQQQQQYLLQNPSNDQMMKMMMYGGMAMMGLIAISLVVKIFKN